MANIVSIRHIVTRSSVKRRGSNIVLGIHKVLDHILGAFVIIPRAEMFELEMTEVAGVGSLSCVNSHMCCQLNSLAKLSTTFSALKSCSRLTSCHIHELSPS